MRARVLTASLVALLGCWGLGWCLPARQRVERVLGPEAGSAALQARLAQGWSAMNARLGPDLLLNPQSWSYGFDGDAVVEPGWTEVPPLLENSARSFYLRSGYEDEPDILRAVARLRPTPKGLNPRIYFYGGGYIYALAAWIAAGTLVTPARLVRGVGWYLRDPARMAWIYRLGRSFSVAVFLATALLLFDTGRRFFGETAGLAAAALYAASPGIVLQAHYMKAHLLGAFFTLAAYRLSAEALSREGARPLVAAGAAAGLAAGAMNHLASSALFPVLAAVERVRAGRPWRREAAALAAAAGACVAAFLVCTPYLLTDFSTTLAAMREVGRFAGLRPSNLTLFAAVGLPRAMTWPVYAVVLWGLVAAWRDRRSGPRRLALAGVALLYPTVFLSQSVTYVDSVKYFGAVTVLFLLGGAAVGGLGRRGRAVAAACVLFGAASCGVLDYDLWRDAPGRSTRDLAGDWIEREVPAGAELCLLRLPQPSNAPYFRWSRYKLHFIEPDVFARLPRTAPVPQWLVVTNAVSDDRKNAGPTLDRYRLVRRFAPFSVPGLGLPLGQALGDPTVDIYERRASA